MPSSPNQLQQIGLGFFSLILLGFRLPEAVDGQQEVRIQKISTRLKFCKALA